ncbi:MAG: hypothetical protein WC815_24085 [Vicinamibacterales bacterium]|jgi:hypothetical protein
MAAGEGQGASGGNVERHIREETIHEDGKEIVVVGIRHHPDETSGLVFPGRKTAEAALNIGFGFGNKPDTLLVDSLYCLSEKEATGSSLSEGLIRQIIDPNTDIDTLSLNFWPVRYAYEHGADLILGDPATSTIPNYFDYIGGKLDQEKVAPYEKMQDAAILSAQTKEYTDAQKGVVAAKNYKFGAKVGFGAGAVLPLVGYGMYRSSKDEFTTKPLTRRQLLKRGLGYVAGTAVGAVGLGQVDGRLSDKVKDLEGKQADLLGGYPVIPDYEVGMTRDDLITRDNSAYLRLSDSVGDLDEADRQTPSFQRIAHYNKETSPIISTLRNAVMADVLSAPIAELTNAAIEPGKEAKVGVVLGASHVLIPEECSVSYLVKHPEKREEILREQLTILVPAIREEYGDAGVTEFLEQLRTFAKRYKVHPDGSVDVSRVHPPLLLSILDDQEFLLSTRGENSLSPKTTASPMSQESPVVSTSTATPLPTEHPTEIPTSSPTPSATPTEEIFSTETPDLLIEADKVKAVRAKHLLEVYGESMDKDTFGGATEPGVFHEEQVDFMKKHVAVSDDLKGDKRLAYKLAATISFFSPGFRPDVAPDTDKIGGLLQLSEAQLRVLDSISYQDMQDMPPIEQLEQVVKPYLRYFEEKGFVFRSVEDLAMATMDPASIAKDSSTPILHKISTRQRPYYEKIVRIFDLNGKKPAEAGVLTKGEIGEAIRLHAMALGELGENLE